MIHSILKKIFYSRLFRDIRFLHYKDAYDQGRFDEDVEKTYELGKYAKTKRPLKDGVEVTCKVEFAGKLPVRERI